MEFQSLNKERPAIWNHKNADHQDRQVVADAQMNIKSPLSFECTMGQLKNKKGSLMFTFEATLRGIKARSIVDEINYNSDFFSYI